MKKLRTCQIFVINTLLVIMTKRLDCLMQINLNSYNKTICAVNYLIVILYILLLKILLFDINYSYDLMIIPQV